MKEKSTYLIRGHWNAFVSWVRRKGIGIMEKLENRTKTATSMVSVLNMASCARRSDDCFLTLKQVEEPFHSLKNREDDGGLTNVVKIFEKQEEHTSLDRATKVAKDIMAEVMQFRRMPNHENCDLPCPSCLSPHLPKVTSAIQQGKPVTFVLPAFPGKSPNLAKVLGAMPDIAEQHSLQFLNQLCNRIRKHYLPGARVILCSDGRVFSDIVGMREKDVTDYQHELAQMIKELNLENLSTFNLDELCDGRDFVQMRNELMDEYGKSLESLREKVRRGGKLSENSEDQEAHRMYCGITRFLFEDSMYPGQTKSRTAVQKDSRIRAYQVIRRSNAWSELIGELFPDAVRFSIHPQTCGAKKLGIRLMEAESWMTPWHGVAMKTDEGFVLLKRSQAEALGAQMVCSENGRPSHYDLTASQTAVNLESRKIKVSL